MQTPQQQHQGYECVRIRDLQGNDVDQAYLTHASTVEVRYRSVHVLIAVDVSTSLLSPHQATGLLGFDHLLPNVLVSACCSFFWKREEGRGKEGCFVQIDVIVEERESFVFPPSPLS